MPDIVENICSTIQTGFTRINYENVYTLVDKETMKHANKTAELIVNGISSSEVFPLTNEGDTWTSPRGGNHNSYLCSDTDTDIDYDSY